MNEQKKLPGVEMLLDTLSLSFLRLASTSNMAGEHPLLRIANTAQFDKTPWLFDSVTGKLHVRGCPSIPAASTSALYAVHRRDNLEGTTLRCKRCSDMKLKKDPPNDASDMLFGILALIEQFGTILRERGNEFRRSPRGKEFEKSLSPVIEKIDKQQKGAAGIILSVMEQLNTAINTLSVKAAATDGPSTKKVQPPKKPATKRPNRPTNRPKRSKGDSQ